MPTPSIEPQADLDAHIARLGDLAMELGVPVWKSVRMTERLQLAPESKVLLRIDQVWGIQEYRERFRHLVTRGWSWVNLHAYGLLGDSLIVDLDWPRYAPGEVLLASVNLSGPENWVRSRGWRLEDVLEIPG